MNAKLSQKQIGKRITELRKRKGLSQEAVAQKLGLSRSSYVQIELGNRGVDIFELQNMSLSLGFSLDEIMAKDFEILDEVNSNSDLPSTHKQERISVPTFQINKFKNVLLYILERCAGKPNVGETVLYKLLYFSDFNYYELYEEHLTGAVYRKLPYGPVPQKLDSLIHKMLEMGQIQRIKSSFHGFSQTRYIPLVKPNLTELRASETEVLDRVIEQMSDWSASAISNYSHKDMPWLATKEGAEINYELAFYRDAPFSVRNYDYEEKES